MNAPILLVVDVQNGFTNDQTREMVPAIVHLVEEWKKQDGKVVFTRFVNVPDSQWVRLLDWSKFMDTPEIELVEEIKGLATAVVDKQAYTSLVDDMRRHLPEPPETIYICGFDTDICVLKTSVDLFENGYRPVVITDACASHAGPELHEAALQILRRFIGDRQLTTMEEALRDRTKTSPIT